VRGVERRAGSGKLSSRVPHPLDFTCIQWHNAVWQDAQICRPGVVGVPRNRKRVNWQSPASSRNVCEEDRC